MIIPEPAQPENAFPFRFWTKKTLAERFRRRSVQSDGVAEDAPTRRRGSDPAVSERRRSSLVKTAAILPAKLRAWSSKTTVVAVEPTQEGNHTASAEVKSIILTLPVELILQITTHLDLADIVSLRTASRLTRSLITANEAQITRQLARQLLPSYALDLYPLSTPQTLDFHYLSRQFHRLLISSRLASHLADFVTIEILRRTSTRSRRSFQHKHEGMRRRMTPMIFTLVHHFETFRAAYLQSLSADIETDANGENDASRVVVLEIRQMAQYDADVLRNALQLYTFLFPAFQRHLRPPTYAGRLERSLRGWSRAGPPAEAFSALFTIGGIREAERIWSIRVYERRRKALDDWLDNLTKPETEDKDKMPDGIPDGTGLYPSRLIAGQHLPMPPLSHKDAALLLRHLPDARYSFTHSACMVLHQKGAITSLADIKCSSQFINELLEDEDSGDERSDDE
ncbi:MAG: hypothetical protein M1817_004243 [Caeruleum heppii]|nr:MAG: hypothetical protein M1817_004243 [Caeruleum heppii]